MYFWIDMDEDGDLLITAMTKEQAEERINREVEGECFHPVDASLNYIGATIQAGVGQVGSILIKGEVVTPKPVETVVTYEI